MQKQVNRRKFLKHTSCAAIGYSTLFSTLINLKATGAAAMTNSAVADCGNDYKALVCILLQGGNDSFNMLVPTGQSQYLNYQNSRSNLALNSNQLLSLNGSFGGETYGLHHAMPNLRNYFNQGKAAFVSNVGTLVEPITHRDQVWNETANLPLGLLSHSDQVMHWQTAFPHARTATGWGGRITDLMNDMCKNPKISSNISLSGSNVFQTGNHTIEFAIDSEYGSQGIGGYNESEWSYHVGRTNAINSMLDQNYADVFKKSYVDTIRNAQDAHEEFSAAIGNAFDFSTSFIAPNEDYGLTQRMEMVAKTISVKDQIGAQRQTFFVEFGGWDHHDEVLNSQNDMLGMLDFALNAFQSAMAELGMEDQVTTFTISDFARTLTSNGEGTDHGWGGNVFALGGAVNGANIYGEFPNLALNNPLDIGGGVLIPTTSADLYFAELAKWFGVSNAELDIIFPNLSEFHAGSYDNLPLGLMNI